MPGFEFPAWLYLQAERVTCEHDNPASALHARALQAHAYRHVYRHHLDMANSNSPNSRPAVSTEHERVVGIGARVPLQPTRSLHTPPRGSSSLWAG